MVTTSKESVAAQLAGRVLAYTVLHPRRRRPHRSPSDVSITDWSRVQVTASDGVRLDAWLIPGDSSRLAVVGHGIGLSKSASLGQAAFLGARGYTVLMFDHRNHGLSASDWRSSDMAARFTTDIESCVDWLQRTSGDPDAKTVVFGYSFSTFPSFYAVARGNAAIAGIVCDSGPGLTLESLFEGFMRTQPFPKIPGFRSADSSAALKRATAKSAVRMLGADWPPDSHAGRLPHTPMLFLVGADDPIILPDEVERLASDYEQATVAVIEGGHLRGFKVDEAGYLERIARFLDAIEHGGTSARDEG